MEFVFETPPKTTTTPIQSENRNPGISMEKVLENAPKTMEKVLENPPKTTPIQSESLILEEPKTPPQSPSTNQNTMNSATDSLKTVTPNRLKVPKAFKYPERYTSPTDLIMSPVSKGLLARSRKPGALLPPSRNQPKIQDLHFQEVGLFTI